MKGCALTSVADFEDWTSRGEYWSEQFRRFSSVHDHLRKFLHEPLILSGHGVKLRIDRGTLLIRNGFTHYPQQAEEHRFFPRDRRLPSRIVILDGDGGITFDALDWLAAQGLPLVQISWCGGVISTSGGVGYAADLDVLRAQLAIQDSAVSLSFACHLIEAKIINSVDTVRQIFEPSPAAELAIGKLKDKLSQIRKKQPSTISELLGAEGLAAATYFRCWHSRPLQWKGVGKKPIPDDWNRIGSRMSDNKWNKFATHPVNAMLNYAYGMLENQVRATVLAMGFDPTIGCLHAYEQNRPTLIFDLMEPLRPIIDRTILEFIGDHVFSPSDFVINNMGVCKLHPQFARVVVKLVQDIQEIENITVDNLKRLLALHPAISKKAGKNITSFKARLVGRRE